MKKRNAHRLFAIGISFCLGCFIYCGSALRPFLISPQFITEEDVPPDAIPMVENIQKTFRMGLKPRFSFPAYVELLMTPSRHKVRSVVTRYPMENAVLIQDLNTGSEVSLKLLGDKWKKVYQGGFDSSLPKK